MNEVTESTRESGPRSGIGNSRKDGEEDVRL